MILTQLVLSARRPIREKTITFTGLKSPSVTSSRQSIIERRRGGLFSSKELGGGDQNRTDPTSKGQPPETNVEDDGNVKTNRIQRHKKSLNHITKRIAKSHP